MIEDVDEDKPKEKPAESEEKAPKQKVVIESKQTQENTAKWAKATPAARGFTPNVVATINPGMTKE